MSNDRIIKILQILEGDVIGSSADKLTQKYASDIDIEEYYTIGKLEDLLTIFRNKFKKIKQMANTWIIDFKLGVDDRAKPYRWTYSDIMRGYKTIGTGSNKEKVYFISQFTKRSMIKMDIVSIVDNRLKEFSINYYFDLQYGPKKGSTYTIKTEQPDHYQDVEIILLHRAMEYAKKNMLMKSLKRIYAFYRFVELKTNSKQYDEIAKLIKLFNSKAGRLNKIVSQLSTVELMINKRIEKKAIIPLKIFKNELMHINNDLPKEYKQFMSTIIQNYSNLSDILPLILLLKQKLNDDINKMILKYSYENKLNISPNNILNQWL